MWYSHLCVLYKQMCVHVCVFQACMCIYVWCRHIGGCGTGLCVFVWGYRHVYMCVCNAGICMYMLQKHMCVVSVCVYVCMYLFITGMCVCMYLCVTGIHVCMWYKHCVCECVIQVYVWRPEAKVSCCESPFVCSRLMNPKITTQKLSQLNHCLAH